MRRRARRRKHGDDYGVREHVSRQAKVREEGEGSWVRLGEAER